MYNYAGNEPLTGADPLCLDTAVIVGGPTGGNPFGHSAIATTGSGVTSFGTGTPAGGSTTDYLASQAEYRDSTVYIIATTPEQESAIQDALAGFAGEPLPDVPSPDSDDTCASRTNAALAVAGLLDPSNPLATLGALLGAHSPLPESSAAIGALESGGNSVHIPQGTTNIPSSLNQFNPQ